MRTKEILALGVPRGEPLEMAQLAVKLAAQEWGMKKGALRQALSHVLKDPASHRDDELFGALAEALIDLKREQTRFVPRGEPAEYRKWGNELEEGAVSQMDNACSLPVSVRGALMPDAHQGYGLPIGGVLATDNAVIPYAVGMDIACRMKLSILDWPIVSLEKKRAQLIRAIENETRFGVGSSFRQRRQHPVMDRNWSETKMLRGLKDRAWAQLGTSGSGNHFVEFGTLSLNRDELGLEKGTYLALMSHSGSRGAGGEIARHYSSLAMKQRRELPRELRHLAWFSLDSGEGQEYWLAMELMGRYAAANHELIHRHVLSSLGAEVVAGVENHHNFAWKELHSGKQVVVHRKGATPAFEGLLGVIPGSMATPGFVVRGKGERSSLCSASHGAGRRMSRKAAKRRYEWSDLKRVLNKKGVTLLSAGLDEVPMAYKDIGEVMKSQQDLVEPIAEFLPKLVKMAPGGERPED